MARVHYLRDRVRISRKQATLNRGVVDNDLEDRKTITDPIPCRIRNIAGAEETGEGMKKVTLPIGYELVLYNKDINGKEICPKQHDEFILEYARDDELVGTNVRLRIVGAIEEVRRRTRLETYIIPVVADTEF